MGKYEIAAGKALFGWCSCKVDRGVWKWGIMGQATRVGMWVALRNAIAWGSAVVSI